MAARPTVTVQKEGTTVPLPKVFSSPIRFDIVRLVHRNMLKNLRKPYAVSRRAGHQYSAESWGTGRAVARIPRVSGGGTNRSGQGAFGNMCRGGRMFAPTKVFRKWTAKSSRKVRRLAVRAALAASAVPALVFARGHRIAKVPEIPLVVSNAVTALEKTRDAAALFKDLGVLRDVERVKFTKRKRAGKGKMRNRRFVKRKGPLVVFSKRCPAFRAFRNIPGVDIQLVRNLNLLRLAPGGHLGRLIVWTEDAFNSLDKYLRVKTIAHVPDSKRIINSEEVQSLCRAKVRQPKAPAKQRLILNPAAPLEREKDRKLLLQRMHENRDPKKRIEKKLARRKAKKELLDKLKEEALKQDPPKKKKSSAPKAKKAKTAPKSAPKASAKK